MTFHIKYLLDCYILLFFLCKLTMAFSYIFSVVVGPCEAREHDLVQQNVIKTCLIFYLLLEPQIPKKDMTNPLEEPTPILAT